MGNELIGYVFRYLKHSEEEELAISELIAVQQFRKDIILLNDGELAIEGEFF